MAELLDRFLTKIDERGPLPESRPDLGPCCIWTAAVGSHGYGVIGLGRADEGTDLAHRVAWKLFISPIPDGFQLDHLCRVRLCVRLSHLELVSQAENIARSDAPSAMNARKTHCNYGHEFTPENTRIIPSRPNNRYCCACDLRRKVAI